MDAEGGGHCCIGMAQRSKSKGGGGVLVAKLMESLEQKSRDKDGG